MSEQIILTVVSFSTMAALLPLCMFILWKRPRIWHTTLAGYLGVLVGFVNLRSDDVILPVLLLLSFGFFLGFSNPVRGWMRAVLLAVWVPVGQIVHLALTTAPAPWIDEGVFSLFAFIPAFLGCYSGIILYRFSAHPARTGEAEPAHR